jgi:hypothetical protein
MREYQKIEKTHFLSSYDVMVPNWTGLYGMRSPFSAWSSDSRLPWYEAYNTTKHDRHSEFEQATFNHLIDACCGLLVLLSAQFVTNDFSSGSVLLATEGRGDGMESGIGEYFRVKFPNNMPAELRYDFDWQSLKNDDDPFQNFDYNSV